MLVGGGHENFQLETNPTEDEFPMNTSQRKLLIYGVLLMRQT